MVLGRRRGGSESAVVTRKRIQIPGRKKQIESTCLEALNAQITRASFQQAHSEFFASSAEAGLRSVLKGKSRCAIRSSQEQRARCAVGEYDHPASFAAAGRPRLLEKHPTHVNFTVAAAEQRMAAPCASQRARMPMVPGCKRFDRCSKF